MNTIQINNQQEIINIGHLESGVYLLRITDAERMRVVRLVKE
ncbi:MAG: T9SS type A sorting domain-containing protein [Bacteroidetes bacterium]|nr:T9SS type A sorting domain-containing protein [Bacteroidota bacterium]